MLKSTKMNFRQQWEYWWDNDREFFPRYEHERLRYSYSINKIPSYPEYPKLKKKKLYPKEFNSYSKCPKAWNKLYHIRPNRRKWKKFCKDASRLIEVDTYCSIWGFNGQQGQHWAEWDDMDEEMMYCECCYTERVYSADGMPYPSYKRYIYYY